MTESVNKELLTKMLVHTRSRELYHSQDVDSLNRSKLYYMGMLFIVNCTCFCVLACGLYVMWNYYDTIIFFAGLIVCILFNCIVMWFDRGQKLEGSYSLAVGRELMYKSLGLAFQQMMFFGGKQTDFNTLTITVNNSDNICLIKDEKRLRACTELAKVEIENSQSWVEQHGLGVTQNSHHATNS